MLFPVQSARRFLGLVPLAATLASMGGHAQVTPLPIRTEQLNACVNQLTVTVSLAREIITVLQQPDLPATVKMAQISQVLPPDQQAMLQQCMQQSWPPPAPPQG
ncbi:MAG: hypothetical protein IGQ88_11060 [Gloeomargaritaceae cyanobacterium C42_A2020_066]|nr:hypothetical protein [Gloeomargaritaceae cyanobacterium C42_A2020_066]